MQIKSFMMWIKLVRAEFQHSCSCFFFVPVFWCCHVTVEGLTSYCILKKYFRSINLMHHDHISKRRFLLLRYDSFDTVAYQLKSVAQLTRHEAYLSTYFFSYRGRLARGTNRRKHLFLLVKLRKSSTAK